MKKILCVLLAMMFLFTFAQTAFAVSDVVLASRASLPAIVLPANAAPWQRNAANLLRTYLQKITGCGSAAADAPRIVLDDPAVEAPSSGDGAYRIAEREGDLYISGSGQRGTLYGVFGFLQQVCGCRWYTKDLEVVPQADVICVPTGYESCYTPYFEYCETDWRSWHSNLFATANRMDGAAYRGIVPDEWGGGVRYLSGFAHTLTTQFCKAEQYFDSHPEYFALRDGERKPAQLCLTNPEVLRIVTGEVLALLRQKHNPNETTQIVSLTQNDNREYCTCPACAALDERNGAHAGSLITFVNAVADSVRDAGYDNVAIDTFAYQYTRSAPSAVVPRPNVIVRLCSIECCFGHTLDDAACTDNAAFMQDLRDWSSICSRIYIWDYGTNYSETFNFFPNLRVLQRNMQVFYEHNVRGIYGEGNFYVDRCDGEFGDLRSYLQCRVMADPYLDYDDEMNGFLRAYYGAGWKNIREFIDLCCENSVTATKHAGIYQRSKGSLPGLTNADVRRCDALWRMAHAAVSDEVQRARVGRSELCWRYWKASNAKSEFAPYRFFLRRMQAREALYQDILAYGNLQLGEGGDNRTPTQCETLYLLDLPIYWSKQYENASRLRFAPIVRAVYDFLNGIF
ncbi:MAG: DUF4838 domain-containing protein [Clostridia bacterium]|nr:DUF4838 domain-containing protein [Clostridia bacterium]